MNAVETEKQPSSLIAVSELTPPIAAAGDADVDIEILKSVPKQFAITDEKTANWLVKKVIAAREYGQRVKEWAEQEQRRAVREEQCLMFLFGRQIEAWVKDQIESLNGKRKSLNLPAGTVGFRTINPSLQVDDEVRVMDWARERCPNAVVSVTTKKLVKAELKAYFESTGEVPEDGAHIDQGGERFFIK